MALSSTTTATSVIRMVCGSTLGTWGLTYSITGSYGFFVLVFLCLLALVLLRWLFGCVHVLVQSRFCPPPPSSLPLCSLRERVAGGFSGRGSDASHGGLPHSVHSQPQHSQCGASASLFVANWSTAKAYGLCGNLPPVFCLRMPTCFISICILIHGGAASLLPQLVNAGDACVIGNKVPSSRADITGETPVGSTGFDLQLQLLLRDAGTFQLCQGFGAFFFCFFS